LKFCFFHRMPFYDWDAAHNIELDPPERISSVVQRFLERSDAFMVNYA
jgi:hypothetical protein